MDTTTNRVMRLISYCLVLALVLLIVTPQLAAASGASASPSTALYGDSDDDDSDDEDSSHSPKGRIVLHTQPGAWTVVQWQGGMGQWHEVEGWRGQAQDGTIAWAVEEKDFGSGPFRWVVYHPQAGRIVGASYPFYLPHANQTVTVTVYDGWQPAPEPWRQPRQAPQPWQQPQCPHPGRWHPRR